jgi:hypothetical protein
MHQAARRPVGRISLSPVEVIEHAFYYGSMRATNGPPSTDGLTAVVRPHLGDQAEQLLTATDTAGMMEAAQALRLTALDMRQRLMRPLPKDISDQKDLSTPDPELRRTELADLAVDVVTAADYLLRLLAAPAVTTSRFTLAGEADAGRFDEESFDRLTRRRLDARGTAVRLGMRLLAELRSDVDA